MTDEQRHARRVSIRTDVWIGIHGMWIHTAEQLRDLSIGGAYITPFDGLRPGGLLDVKFRLPGDDAEFLCPAIVRHTGEGGGIGVQFLDLHAGQRERIEAFVATRAPAGAPADAADEPDRP